MKNHPVLSVAFVGLLAAGLAGCATSIDKDAQQKEVNNAQIRQYLAARNLTALTTTSGLHYFITRANPNPANNPLPTLGDSLVVHYVASTLDDKRIDSTSVRLNQPFKFFYQIESGRTFVEGISTGRVLPGLDEAVGLMRAGERATALVPANLAFRQFSAELNNQPVFAPYAVLRLDLQLLDVLTESKQIDGYIRRNNLPAPVVTASGLRFIRTLAQPDSLPVAKDSTVFVRYTGKLLNGATFDTNVGSAQLFSFKVGQSPPKVVPGYDEGVARMRIGERATLIFPSALGYADKPQQRQGAVTIYPYAPLVFEVEVIRQRKTQ